MTTAAPSAARNSPRIRGDGPTASYLAVLHLLFSPYSRGWSGSARPAASVRPILPVFAGMVLVWVLGMLVSPDSPRIRGDGPTLPAASPYPPVFSPYSRGWSRPHPHQQPAIIILPVFAGMVPDRRASRRWEHHSPRIRGDGPINSPGGDVFDGFSPYSRGWSRIASLFDAIKSILPVFAGMVPIALDSPALRSYSPRIRGDGPTANNSATGLTEFSPYSRGWSHPAPPAPQPCAILPVFAGMVPARNFTPLSTGYSPRIRGDGPPPCIRLDQNINILPVFAGMVLELT